MYQPYMNPDPDSGEPEPVSEDSPEPPPPDNPYAPPVSAWNDPALYDEPFDEGTYWGGFAAGFIFALLGWLVVYAMGKSETKRGALHGFGIRLGLSLLLLLFAI